MADNFNRQVLRVAVAQICQSMGWDALQKSTHDTLTDVMQRYLEEIGKVAYSYTQLCEKEENTSAENATFTSAEETEKIKSTPLKESSNVMESSDNVAVKRRHEGGMLFPRDNKRSRFDIPANLSLEKKENLENTDAESLSPATPVSPYLPQDLPKIPEEPAKAPSFIKAKAVQKQMVLPLQKLTPPEKKTKTETSPSSKKPKIKKEKSISPKVQNIVASPSSKSEMLSPVKKPSSTKNSPSAKKKSPMNVKSPVVEKQIIKKSPNKGSENKAPTFSSKSSPSKELLSKAIPAKKSPSIVEGKKDVGSPKVKGREFKPMKKKKLITDEMDKGTSAHNADKTTSSPSLNTPKLMIKLLPKSDQARESPKSSPVEQKISTTPVKVKTASSPSSTKALIMKPKTSEGVVKSEKKSKISSESLEIAVLKKEHSKKKKKKKDKDKDKDKEKSIRKEKRKSDKAEPPIPKIRFKLDPSGESKTGETMTSSSKSATSSSQSSSKKTSRIVIETENVSIITETWSNTLDYDPDRAYFCPVCHKQDDGSPMVGCDGCDEWCHWPCVGLMAAPPESEKWYCPLCLVRKDKTKKGKSKKKS
ncbi:transcription initiation factor TFIID subunit 3 [Paramuricea clavata]|uniref:Transcription initiation factor TFIID subunit 3 n=1 Tax=Paramuricea clavata TaxID=317549 RepID=A0A7D9HQ55_PARCT|nr:transcription initiation factor TFIID subunit 3 [Paramuricea clavata]